MRHENSNLYLLIDNGLLQAASAGYSETDSKRRPTWLMPIYAERALEVSPFLIDMDEAYEAGQLDQVMAYVNALVPALHVSIIETALPLAEMAQHLRRFIFILDPDGKQRTLRCADGAVLMPLSSVLTEAQWAAMRRSIARWCVHDRSGRVIELRSVPAIEDVPTPLRLERDQIAALDEASEPDHCLAKVKMMHHGAEFPGTAEEQYHWANEAHQAWRASGNPSQLYFLFLTEAALTSRGKVLQRPEISEYLLMDDIHAFKINLRALNDKA